MSSSHMTQWIENAEARKFYESVMSDRRMGIGETQYVHLGNAVAKAISWTRLSISRDSLRAMGKGAFAFAPHLPPR
jgi:hypothetical protein